MSIFYQVEVRNEDTLDWEWGQDYTHKQDAIDAYRVLVDNTVNTPVTAQIVEVDSDGKGKVLHLEEGEE